MDSNRIAAIAQRQSENLRTLEQRAIADATRPLAQALTEAQAAATARWVRETVGAQIPARLADFIDWVRGLLRNAFANKPRQAQAAAERTAFAAAVNSLQQATALATAMSSQPSPAVTPAVGPEAQEATDQIPAAVQEEQGRALALLAGAGLGSMGLAGLHAVFKRARKAVGRIATAMAVAINSATAHAARLVAQALGPGVRLVWAAEPGACPACAAYAGRHIRPGGLFPGGLSLDPQRTVFTAALAGPPRHPHCRCVVIAWSPSWPITGTPLPALLRQQARTTRRP